MKKLLIAFVLCGTFAFAQLPTGPRPGQRPGPAGQPGAPAFDAIKTELGLTDSQIQSLTDLRRQRAEANREVAVQLREKQQTLRQKVEAKAPAAEVGALVYEVQALREKLRTTAETETAAALNLLTSDQRQKLAAIQAKLEEAAKLRPAMNQARILGLLSPPEPGAGPLGVGPGPAGMGMGGRMGAGPGGVGAGRMGAGRLLR